MVPRLLIVCVVSLVAAAGCAHHADAPLASAAPCDSIPPHSAVPYTRDLAPMLVGRFQLTAYNTTDGPVSSVTKIVALRLADSIERAASKVKTLAHAPNRDLQLVDAHLSEPDTIPGPRSVQVDDGLLLLGCRDCLDGIIVVYRIAAVSPSGFWGTWKDPQTGIGQIVDKQGHPLPDPAGFFCAIRATGP